jgi:tetratricopeptide (TPR) repeat protein
VYERAIANIPPSLEKRAWRRYVYLWIGYAVFEELLADDPTRARAVYAAALKVIPHSSFTFAKLWILAAQLELRQRRLDAARRVLGEALGRCPKDKIFKAYIDVELEVGGGWSAGVAVGRLWFSFLRVITPPPCSCATLSGAGGCTSGSWRSTPSARPFGTPTRRSRRR